MTDILLLCMPFSHLELPLMATGLLKSQLARNGYTCEAKYLHLDFAALIGFEQYEIIDKQCTDDWKVGEWLFSHHVFGERAATVDQYLSVIAPFVSEQEDFRDHLLLWQSQVDVFIEHLLANIDWNNYKIVGFSLVHQQTIPSLALARHIKERHPDVVTIFGGGSCQGKMGQSMYQAFDWIDYLCTGEGDHSFPALVDCLLQNKAIPDIPGILHRVDGKTIFPSESTRAIEDLDSLPVPDFTDYLDQLKQNDLLQYVKPGILAEGARGCWWGEKSPCTFCGLNGQTMAFRSKSNERLLSEILSMVEKYSAFSVKRVNFVENILGMKHLREVIPSLRERIKDIELFYEIKVNLRREDINALREAKILKVQPGVESLNDHILKLMAKGATLLQNVQTIKWFMEYGIDPVYNLLYGFPGETPEDYKEMIGAIKLIDHLPQPRAIRHVRLERFSPYFDNPESYGISNIRPSAVYRTVFPLPLETVHNLVHTFEFDYVDVHPDTYVGDWKHIASEWMRHGGEKMFVAASWGEKVICLDTRSGVEEITVLEGTAAKIFNACDAIESASRISSSLGIEISSVQAALDDFVANKQVLNVGTRYLCLAVRVDQYLNGIAELTFENFVSLVRSQAYQLSQPLVALRDEMIRQENYKRIWAN